MFLKQLYRYNKYWLAAFVVFVLLFIYINLKWGYTASPFYQYGMFSGKYHVKDTQYIDQFYTGNTRLDPVNWNFVERDILFTSLQKYRQQKFANKNIYNTILPLYEKLGIAKSLDEEIFLNRTGDREFLDWIIRSVFKKHFSDIKTVTIKQQAFQWQRGKIIPLSEPKTDISFAANP